MHKLYKAAIVILILGFGACKSPEPFDYDSHDKRPGLFTGKDGEAVIYRIK